MAHRVHSGHPVAIKEDELKWRGFEICNAALKILYYPRELSK